MNLKENYTITHGEAWLGFFSVVFLLGQCYVIINMPRVPTEMLADLKLAWQGQRTNVKLQKPRA